MTPRRHATDRAAGRGLAALSLGLLTIGAGRAAQARPNTDIVRLVNGDQATCEIVDMESGHLTARTANFGTVDIEWTDIQGLISTQRFEVERVDGTRLTGTFDLGDKPETLLLRMSDEEWVQVPFVEVIAIRQLGSSIWSSRRGRLNLGLDYAQANEDTQFSFDGDLTFQGRRFRWTNTAVSSISDDASSDRRQRDNLTSTFDIVINKRFEWLGRGMYESNDDLELDRRWTVSGGLVYLPWRSPRGRAGILGGVAESTENYRDEPSHAVTYGVLGVLGEYHRFGDYGTVFSGEITFLPVLSGGNRYRVEFRGSLSQKIASDFNIAISPYYSLDSEPPNPGVNDEDWGWISSVGWRF
jgi:hypothetical protein